ncbi:FAD-binding protein [Antrihabitans sp. NCIMB 15449]|uniref:FAD-binding protein n=1 Tax=Antrihabitans spumae TaxID=3373370 RepID=A0ABW7JQR4_9NOCA
MREVQSMTWDLSADVVVIGYGAAGTSAALEAVAGGAKVVAIDRFNGGGATELSGGVVYAGGGTSIQRAAGVEDTPEAMLAYLTHEVGDAVSPETLRRFVDGSPAMIDWLSSHGVPFEGSLCPYKTSYPSNKHYLYYSGSEAAGAFRGIAKPAPRGHRAKAKGTSGKKISAPLAAAAKVAGVDFRPHTRATKLVTDDEGRVIGVEATTMRDAPAKVQNLFARLARLSAKPGIYYPPLRRALEGRILRLERAHAKPIRIEARSGVIVSAGGFIANRALVKEHAPQYRGGLVLGTTGDDGSGIALAQSVGAATDRLGNVSAWRFIVPPSAFLRALVVDKAGSRVIDESRYGAAVGHALIAEHEGRGWLLADADLVREARSQLGDQSTWFQRLQAEGLFRLEAKKGATVEEVARRAGVDPAGLLATVTEHNLAIDAGEPDPVGKPAEFTKAVRTPPFSLFDISIKPSVTNPCPMLTLGGVVVDEATGAVKTAGGQDIPGLYAAGRTAVGICSNSYVSGLSIADCIFSGRRAGLHAAQRARVAR